MTDTSAITVRSATPTDAQAIVNIFNPIIESGKYTAFDRPFTVEEEASFIANQGERGIFHVAVRQDDGLIVGFQSMDPMPGVGSATSHVGVLGTFVDLTQRRKGIARQLFAKTFDVAPQKGYRKIFTYVRSDNPAALTTYLSQGFRIVGTAQDHALIGGRFIDEIIIEKLL